MAKIEVGKTYQTRNELSARILVTDKKGGHPIAGLITMADGNEIWCSWRENGSEYALGKSAFDLIIPTERKSRWLNWYDFGLSESDHSSREEADRYSLNGAGRTHVLEIITENGKPVDVKIYEVEK